MDIRRELEKIIDTKGLSDRQLLRIWQIHLHERDDEDEAV